MRKKITIENIRDGFNKFFIKNKHYPTSIEINHCDYLPSTRLIERNFGGLKSLRLKLGLEIVDYTRGEARSEMVRKINSRSQDLKIQVKKLLVDIFGKANVHQGPPFMDDCKKSADFLVYYSGGSFFVDLFHPQDHNSFTSCVNAKSKKYGVNTSDKFYLVNTNPEVPCLLEKRKTPLPKNQVPISLDDFWPTIKKFNPLQAF